MDIIRELEIKFLKAKSIDEKRQIVWDFVDRFEYSWITKECKLYRDNLERHLGFYHGFHKISFAWHFVIRRITLISKPICKVFNKQYDGKRLI